MGTTDLAQALGDLQESEVIAGVEEQLSAGKDPMAILADVQAGMEIVGKRFEEGEYYLSELLYAADIFKKVNVPLAEKLQGRKSETLATMVLGTVKNDIHEFGKDIVATILTSNGVEVIDLGVDVDYDAFVAAIREHKPQFVGLSCMLTTVFSDMKATHRGDRAGRPEGHRADLHRRRPRGRSRWRSTSAPTCIAAPRKTRSRA